MPKHRVDVVNLEWTGGPSRDRQMASLVCNYLRLAGRRVVEASVFDGFQVLYDVRPTVFFITNTTGAPENHALMKYADSLDIQGVSLISEGNIRDSESVVRDFVWGWNTEEIMRERLMLMWSRRSRSIVLNAYPELRSKTKVSGGVGFDLYAIAARPHRQTVLRRYRKDDFTRVVGIGCYDFGPFDPQDRLYEKQIAVHGRAAVERFLQDRDGFREMIGSVTKSFPDILFLLKEHPGVMGGRWASGVEGLESEINVLVLKDEEPVFDCLCISDIWFVYESTTALEAWLLGKQTGLLNPSGRDFPRIGLHEGSPCFQTPDEATGAIRSYYETGSLPGFGVREARREVLIKEIIEWSDGLNHVRAGNAILEILEYSEYRGRIAELPTYRKQRIRQHLLWRTGRLLGLLPRFRLYLERRRMFRRRDLESLTATRKSEQLAFYGSRGLTIDRLRGICAEE
jgi:surface carbohydrate biosynthesis protein